MFLLVVSPNWMSLIFALSIVFMVFALVGKHDLDCFNMNLSWGLDSPSYSLIMLSIWIIILMLLSSKETLLYNPFSSLFSMIIIILLSILLVAFSSMNLLVFYVFFEASLVPTFILIMGWGYQPERLQAGVYMMMYTIMASLPLLFVLLYMSNKESSLFMLDSNMYQTPGGVLMFLSMNLAFMVKLPVYILHLWLPKAHVEAPVAGSMILASVLLKLGGYGMLRMMPKIYFITNQMGWVFMSWGMMGGFIVSLICLRQVDIKVLIALSSVAHMAMVFGGILSMSSWGINGALLIMLGHGFCSSGLFCVAGMAYERSGTRSLSLIKGFQSIMPSLTLWWFLLSVANMAAPPSMNLIGEIHSIIGLIHWSFILIIPIAGLTFFAAAYSLYMYSNTQHGKSPLTSFSSSVTNLREHLVMLLHWLPINFLIVKFSILQMFICFSSLYKMVMCEVTEMIF
uniref:NADH-ubiquinone oxidoreductase chain 4 n=1 Tax=Bragasellus peltatus TaxID=1282048 RepID=A0A485M9K8_9CRUS|nr:NADH dehydrogenase subunit 4 [Bragasellus peltatus]